MKKNLQFAIYSMDVLIDGSQYTTFVAMAPNERPCLIGQLSLQHKGAEFACIARLFVSEEYRQSGVGSAMIQAAVSKSRESKCERVNLIVALNNLETLRPFYENRGFERVVAYEDGDTVFSLKL